MSLMCAFCGAKLTDDNTHTTLSIGRGADRSLVGWCFDCKNSMLFDIDVVRGCGGWRGWLDAINQRGEGRVIRIAQLPKPQATKFAQAGAPNNPPNERHSRI